MRELRRLQHKQHDADYNQEWSRGPTAGTDYRGQWKKISPAVIPMTGPVLVPREESDASLVVASNWSGPGGTKWRAGQPRPADGHPTGRVGGDVGSVHSVPSPPARDRLTFIAIFGARPQYLFWQVWNFLGGSAYICGPSASRAPTASSRCGRLPDARHSDLVSATPERGQQSCHELIAGGAPESTSLLQRLLYDGCVEPVGAAGSGYKRPAWGDLSSGARGKPRKGIASLVVGSLQAPE